VPHNHSMQCGKSASKIKKTNVYLRAALFIRSRVRSGIYFMLSDQRLRETAVGVLRDEDDERLVSRNWPGEVT